MKEIREILTDLAEGRAVAAKVLQLPLLRRPTPPEGVLLFLKEKDGWRPAPSRRLQEGMLLVCDLGVEVPVELDNLRCADASDFSLEIRLLVSVDRDSLDTLCSDLLMAREEADIALLQRLVKEALLPCLRRRIEGLEARSLFFGAAGESAIQSAVREASKRLCFKYGLLLRQVLSMRFAGTAYEELRRVEEEAERRAAAVKHIKEQCGVTTDEAFRIAAGLRTEGLTRAKVLFCAAASGIIALNAADAANARPAPTHFNPRAPVRSVRLARHNGETVLLAGTQDGVKMLTPDLSLLEEYRFEEGSHGFNAACILGDSLFASHSQFGLVRWNVGGGKAELLWRQPCRGVTSNGSSLFFASANSVLRFAHPPQLLFETTSPVNALLLAPPFLVAGTNNGRLYFFNLKDSTLTWYDTGAKVYSLALAELARGDAVLVGARTEGVRAVTLLMREAMEFVCGERIRWVAGASDLVFGVAYGLKTLYVWQTDKKLSPQKMSLPDEVYDICLLKEGSDD